MDLDNGHAPNVDKGASPLVTWFRRMVSGRRTSSSDHVPSLNLTREALARAERESAMKSRILATVSHDIRTPLSGIAGMSHLLSQTRLTPEQANYLSGIGQSVQALSQLVDDLLDFSSIEAGRFQLHPREDDLRQLIESVVEMLAHRAHEKGIEIASWVAADVPGLLSFDPERLRQILFNLVGNAVKFTSEGGVLVSACMVEGELEIRVRDTGPGMSARGQEKLFREFEQVGEEKSRIGGTGLGLAISRRIVLEAGGSINVESQPGVGSTFIVRLPVRQASDSRLRQARATMLSSTHMLIIAPDGMCREALSAAVSSLGGKVQHASSPADVVACLDAAADAFTDIVVDRRLADLLSDELRKHAAFRNPATRRILLIDPESRSGSRFFGAGYDSWLVRPLRERSLIGVLQGRMKGIELRDPINDNRSNTRWTQTEGSGLDVIVAEDDPVNRLLLKTVLKKSGHRVAEVETFRDLIAAATQTTGRPGAIVTDLSMPGGNGLDALSAIRDFERANRLSEVPVIVVTGSSSPETRKAAIDAGATELFIKPADPAKLADLLASYAARRAG
ncbi:MAG TPA: ATP-binding protein [Ensifer sp.]|nr:ATP-binding protein [Ensifer sp.]